MMKTVALLLLLTAVLAAGNPAEKVENIDLAKDANWDKSAFEERALLEDAEENADDDVPLNEERAVLEDVDDDDVTLNEARALSDALSEDAEGNADDDDATLNEERALSEDTADGSVDVASRGLKCTRGRCKLCLKFTKKFGACIIGRLVRNRFQLSFQIGSRTFNWINFTRGVTFRIRRHRIRPAILRLIIKSDILIRVSGISLRQRRFCVQARFKIRLFWRTRTIKIPKKPLCMRL